MEIVWSGITVGGVTEAEAGSATKVVVHVNLEVARPASVALSPLNVLLADTLTIFGITVWPVSKTALHHAFTRLAARVSCHREGPIVGSALVALVPCNPWLTVALPIVAALKACRTVWMAVAHDALLPSLGVLLRGGERVFLADLAVCAPAVALTVETFSSAPFESMVVQLLVESALAAPPIAVAGQAFVWLLRGGSLPVPIPMVVQA